MANRYEEFPLTPPFAIGKWLQSSFFGDSYSVQFSYSWIVGIFFHCANELFRQCPIDRIQPLFHQVGICF
jgi:hypothetical protein